MLVDPGQHFERLGTIGRWLPVALGRATNHLPQAAAMVLSLADGGNWKASAVFGHGIYLWLFGNESWPESDPFPTYTPSIPAPIRRNVCSSRSPSKYLSSKR